MTECVSCGKEANPNSPRTFCDTCDSVFEAGIARQAEIKQRAEQLEIAKAENDAETIESIMTEIVRESIVPKEVPTQPESSATVKEVVE